MVRKVEIMKMSVNCSLRLTSASLSDRSSVNKDQQKTKTIIFID